MKIKLYYSVPDHFPAFRVDVSELFGRSLQALGLETQWFMSNDGQSLKQRRDRYFNQSCVIPPSLSSRSILSKVISRLAYWVWDAMLMIKAAFGDFDILQTRDKYIVSVLALIMARLTGKRFVYWCSYPFPEHTRELANEHSGLVRLMLILNAKVSSFLLYRIVMKYADHSFVQTQQMLMDITRYGVAAERMTPVPMGVPSRLLDWASTYSGKVVSGRVVYLGTMASVRHLDMLIDAFAEVHSQCPSATLLMVGDGVKPHERAALEQQAAKLGLTDVIHFTGFVPIEEAWRYAASGAVCVSPIYPSPILNCGSPTKLFEYMALGRPVVGNTHPDQTSVIGRTGAGLCVDWSSSEFSEAIVWMLEHPEAAEVMGAKGMPWVAANRTYPILATLVWQQYQRILGVST